MFDWPETVGSASVVAELHTELLLFFTSAEFKLFCRFGHTNKGRNLLLHSPCICSGQRSSNFAERHNRVVSVLNPLREVPGSNLDLITSYPG
jgi:hypothetical protein